MKMIKTIFSVFIVALLVVIGTSQTTKISKADMPVATDKPVMKSDVVEDWRDTSAFVKSGKYSYRIIDAVNKKIELRKIESDESEIVIPSSIDGYKVVSLGYSRHIMENEINLDLETDFFEVLSNADKLVKLSIPKTVTNIGVRAFYRCRNLGELHLPDSIQYIREYAFYGCKKLSELYLSDEVVMYNEAFAECISLKKVFSKSFYPLCFESRLFSAPINDWYLSQGEDKGIGYYSFLANDFYHGVKNKFAIKRLHIDEKVKTVRLGTMEGEKKNPYFVKKMYVMGKETKLKVEKNLNTVLYTVKGAKAIQGAKKAHMTYLYKEPQRICIQKKSDNKMVKWKAKKTHCVTMAFRKKNSRWVKSSRRVKTKYIVYGKNTKSGVYKKVTETRACKAKIPYKYVKVVTSNAF